MQNKNKQTPSHLEFPCFLMNFPFTVSNDSPNNAWMKDNKEYNYDLAFSQFMQLYHYVSGHALIYLLPSTYEYQDLPFVANIGCYLPHVKEPTIIVANFKSPPRKGEDEIGSKFFESMGYKVHKPPFTWEGEADLKYIRDNIYLGGYGIRTDVRSYKWMMSKFDMKIIPVKMTDEKLYHFDCVIFPLSDTKILAATKVLSKEDIKALESVVEIVDIPEEFIYNGWTNCIRLGNKILHAPPSEESHIEEFKKFITQIGYEPVIMDLKEYEKSGADLSCMFFHFNYNNRDISITKSDSLWWSKRLLKLSTHGINLSKSLLIKTDIAPEYRSVFSQLPITVEYGVGSKKKLKSGMSDPFQYPYGFIEQTKTADGEALDCYLGPNEQASHAYLIKQMKPDSGEFDEIKCMLGFDSVYDASKAYLDHYKDQRFFGGVIPLEMNEFKRILGEKQNLQLLKSIILVS